MERLILGILFLLPIHSGHAEDEALPTSMLKQLGDNDALGDKTAKSICMFYIAGLADGLFFSPLLAKQGDVACFPEMPSGNEAVSIAQKFMSEHPEFSKLSAAATVSAAITAAYPCKPN